MRVHVPMLLLLFMGVTLWAQAEPTVESVSATQDLNKAENEYNEIVLSYCAKDAESISVKNARPDGQIAQDLGRLYKIVQTLDRISDGDGESTFLDRSMFEARVIETVKILQQRQLYRYLWWVEYMFLRYTTGEYENINRCSEQRLISAYRELSKIDLSLVTEIMVAREITALMGHIYDELSDGAKRSVRQYGIKIRHDVYSAESSSAGLPRLYRPEDF